MRAGLRDAVADAVDSAAREAQVFRDRFDELAALTNHVDDYAEPNGLQYFPALSGRRWRVVRILPESA